MTEPRHPLRISEKRSYFKPFVDDVGLLCQACGMDVRPVQLHLRISLASIYKLIHQGHPNYGKPFCSCYLTKNAR